MSRFNLNNFLMLLVTSLVVKAVISQSFSLSEAFLAISIVGYSAFNKYLEHNKVKLVEKDFEKRLTAAESKISFIGSMGKTINNR